ncbi:MAG: AMP-binding protein [Elainellaceae cyanobacterium]
MGNRITDEFVGRATQAPQKAAVVLGDRVFSYGELLEEIQQVAAYVDQLTPQSRSWSWTNQHVPPWVALLCPNRIELIQGFLGTAMAGGVAMVLSPRWSKVQLESILNHWPPDWLIGEAVLLAVLEATGSDKSGLITTLSAAPSIVPSPLLPEGWRSPPAAFAMPLEGSTLPNDQHPFYICFTSGTTGQPKGIVKTHRSWLDGLAASRAEFGIAATDRVLVPGSLSHSLSLYAAVEALSAGAALHLLPQTTGGMTVAQLQSWPITVIVAVPTLLHLLATEAQAQGLKFPAVRLIISGGSKLSARVAQALAWVFPQARVIEYYGASELGFVSIRDSNAVPAGAVGRPFKGVSLSIQRQDGLGEAAPGECGWVSVRSTLLCSGYLDLEHRDKALGFRQVNGWWTVGDRGWRDEQGYLYLAGREKMLVCSGINVYPAEVEAALLQLPEVAAAVVLGLSDDCRGDVIHAVVVWRAAPLSRRSLRLRLRPHLSRHALPRRVYALPELPLNPSGKVARGLLTERLGRGELNPYEVRS